MPAASISNGHTGPLKTAGPSDIADYLSIMRPAAGTDDCGCIAHQTIGRQLHVVEFWMPGGCNLSCTHCYVAATKNDRPIMRCADFVELTSRLVQDGLIDVVVPGMEPLLRDETWAVVDAAYAAGARSIGLTTNATLLKRRLAQVAEAPLTVINVSLDGPQAVHDDIRGKGVFRIAMEGVDALREAAPGIRLISNCTANRWNVDVLPAVAELAGDRGFTFAAFHPFERSDGIDNSIELTAGQTVDGYEAIRAAFDKGRTGSVVLEMEASRFDVLLELSERGWFSDMELLSDETGFLFFGICRADATFLVNLMAYPHHFIRTLRVADDGGLSSCRSMAQSSWAGIGDLRKDAVSELLSTRRAREGLAHIWSEFKAACDRAPSGSLDRFLRLLDRAQNAMHAQSSMARKAA